MSPDRDMPVPDARARREGRRRLRRAALWRFFGGLHAGLALALAVAVAGMLHYVAARYYARWDVSRSGGYALSEKSRSMLAALDGEVEATIFFEGGHALYREVDTLLREYQYASPHIRVVRVDPDRDPGRTEELIRRFPVTERNVVVFHAEGRTQVVRGEDLAEYEDGGVDGGLRRMSVFHGEPLFSSAILSVTQARRPRVLFLSGQGEKSIDSTDAATGLSTLARLVRQDNIDVQASEWSAAGILDDVDALVVVGPRHRFPQPLLDRIDAFLEARGRAVFLLDAGIRTGLEPVLEDRGLKLEDDVVVDPTRTVTGREVLVLQYGSHPITTPLRGVTSIFYQPRSVEPAEIAGAAADRPRVVRLALTSDAGWAERDYDRTPMRFDAGRDRPGPVAMAAAAEYGAVSGLDVQIRPGRIVVFGDSGFVVNGRLTGGNADLFLGALNWLLEREELLAVSPRRVETIRLNLSAAQVRWLGWLVIAALPGAVAVLGLLVRLRRRR